MFLRTLTFLINSSFASLVLRLLPLSSFSTPSPTCFSPIHMSIWRVLRHHGLGEDGLWTVFRAVVVSRLIYAASAWIGFTTRTDIQRIDAFLRRCKRGGYCSPDLSDFVQLVEEGDDRLFRKIINNSSHVLHELLPPPTTTKQ